MKKHLNLILSITVMVILGVVLVLVAKFAVPVNPMQKIYGPNYKATVDAEFETNSIVYKKEKIKGTRTNGSIYYLTYDHEFAAAKGTIEIKLAVNETDKILGYELLKYEHTKDSVFMTKALKYLDSYIDTQVEDIKLTHEKNLSLSAGATESSVNTIYVMLDSLRKSLSNDPYADYFGEYVIEADSSFTPTETVISKEVVTGNTNGFIYVGEKSHSFNTGHGIVEGKIQILLILNEEGLILAYELPVYEHSAGAFKDRIISYLDSFVKTNIADIELTHADNMNKYANSSETGDNVIYPILKAIMEVNN